MLRKNSYAVTIIMLITAIWFFYPTMSAKAQETEWATWKSHTGVPVDKVWTISFTKPIDIATANEHNIYVLDAKGNKVDVSFIIDNDGKDLVIEPPETNYKIGETYTLYITDKVQSKSQQLLKKPTKMAFTVGKQAEKKTEQYTIRTDSKNIVEYQENVEILTEQQGESLQLLRPDMIQVTAGAHVYEMGDVIVFPPSEQYPLGLSKKIVSIEKNSTGYLYNVTTPKPEDLLKKVDISQQIPVTLEHLVGTKNPALQTAVASLNSKVLPNGIIAVLNGGDLELSFRNLKIGDAFYASGGFVLKNPHFIVDLNDESLDLLEDATVVFKTDVEIQASAGVRPTAKASENLEERILLAQMYVPIPQFPLLGGNFELYAVIGVEGNIQFELKRSLSFEVGAQWTDGDYEPIRKFTLPKEDGELEPPEFSTVMQISAKLGVGVEAAVAITSEVKLASISVEAGGKTTQTVFDYKNTACYKGTTSIYLDAQIQTEAIKRLEFKLLGIEKMLQTAETCPYVTELVVEPKSMELKPGETKVIDVVKKVFIGRDDHTLDFITFESSNPELATVNENGRVTAKDDAKPGSFDVLVVYSRASNFKTEKVRVTIVEAEEEPIDETDPNGSEINPEEPVDQPAPVDNIVNIPDALLEEKIRSMLKIPTAPIRESDMKKLTNLHIFSVDKNLDLTGLEYAVNLEGLDITEATKLDNLQAIGKLPKLKRLNLTENNITDLTPLQTLPSIENLNVSNNKLKNIAPVSKMTTLEQLFISNNEIVDITPIGTLTNLTSLGAGYNKIVDISVLSKLKELELLTLWYNKIENISALQSLPRLYDVVLESNAITDVSPLKNATRLQGLNIGNNKVKDISSLSKLTDLVQFTIYNNQISNISVVKNYTNLKTLAMNNNAVQDISAVKGLTKLETLFISENKVSKLDALANLKNLMTLNADENNISTIKPLANLTKLTRINLQNNNVNDITLLHNLKDLSYLNVRGNPVPRIHLDNFEKIPGLYLVR